MIPILLLAILQAAPAQEQSIESQVEAFLKGDAKAREALLKAGASAMRPLLKSRDQAPEKVESLASEIRTAAAHPKGSSMPKTLEKKGSFRFKEIDYDGAIGFVQARTGVIVQFDDFDANDLESIQVTVEVADVSGRAALDLICRQTGLDYAFFHNAVVIGKPERLWPSGKTPGAFGPSGAERQVQTPADKTLFQQLGALKVALDFKDVPFPGMVDYVREISGVDFAVEGDAGDRPLTWKCAEARLVDTLSLVTQSRGLDFMLRDGKVVIGTREAIEKQIAGKK